MPRRSKNSNATLLYAANDLQHNQAIVLQRFLGKD
ncbi:uncharacterized protein YeaO (DUF488 family) [Rhizobium leguminosarum]|uniref:Uncharacterized protein YeaO (DUF488 family) n=2 Tax=Rhizobium leguminosarum TaxID=384 RepID=A0A7W9ZPA7_RHILE|nr:hypothetical protein Rleg2_4882 [Rhizobium leguminosarum bv. trifolii WSM2304]MBB5663796.1 uncharacterized protein YeaO (DUF488 family) [Rhizobium leguminosarum]MBB6219698.1 uncharacterized protein YeaO (DUF488 family) [Rhizobium leguminosarum]NYJ13149.1 uncharacterized protein YeaO (DUF488 family) [Rhizobium leguminosarum]